MNPFKLCFNPLHQPNWTVIDFLWNYPARAPRSSRFWLFHSAVRCVKEFYILLQQHHKRSVCVSPTQKENVSTHESEKTIYIFPLSPSALSIFLTPSLSIIHSIYANLACTLVIFWAVTEELKWLNHNYQQRLRLKSLARSFPIEFSVSYRWCYRKFHFSNCIMPFSFPFTKKSSNLCLFTGGPLANFIITVQLAE